ncbi:MAG: GIY-YIG nuclease family protein [Chloroflexi bacterium]|nr:GIY-YIG nuclease family protein [Chloroflexota bacterium]
MFRRRHRHNCGYWDCDKRIPEDDFLCAEHYQSWAEGVIDRCPKCGRFKDIMYRLCLDCYFGRKVAQWQPPGGIPPQKQNYRVEYSDAWVDGYMRSDKFFIFILEFDDGGLYVGHTADLTSQLSGYKKQKESANAGRNPRLQYVQMVATKEAAELREAELKKLLGSNPEQVHLMIADFRGRMHELGYEEYA